MRFEQDISKDGSEVQSQQSGKSSRRGKQGATMGQRWEKPMQRCGRAGTSMGGAETCPMPEALLPRPQSLLGRVGVGSPWASPLIVVTLMA